MTFFMNKISGIGIFFFSSRRRHTRLQGDWSSDVCSSDLDNNNIKRLGMIGHSGKCLVGAKGKRKLSSRITERERQGVRHTKLIVNGKNVHGPCHRRCTLASMTRTSPANTFYIALPARWTVKSLNRYIVQSTKTFPGAP